MEKSKLEIWISAMGFCIVIILLTAMVISWFSPSQKEITFNVVGIVNGTEATSLIQVHFECIKYCTGHIRDSYMKDCWEQCQKLGKEGCNG